MVSDPRHVCWCKICCCCVVALLWCCYDGRLLCDSISPYSKTSDFHFEDFPRLKIGIRSCQRYIGPAWCRRCANLSLGLLERLWKLSQCNSKSLNRCTLLSRCLGKNNFAITCFLCVEWCTKMSECLRGVLCRALLCCFVLWRDAWEWSSVWVLNKVWRGLSTSVKEVVVACCGCVYLVLVCIVAVCVGVLGDAWTRELKKA